MPEWAAGVCLHDKQYEVFTVLTLLVTVPKLNILALLLLAICNIVQGETAAVFLLQLLSSVLPFLAA